MSYPDDRKYTKEHEWVLIENGKAKMGITNHAQEELGEIVFVEVPEAGKEVSAGDTVCVVESTKAASDVYAPIGGKVVEGNAALEASPDLVNSDPHGEGWMVLFEGFSEDEVQGLMTAAEYTEYIS